MFDRTRPRRRSLLILLPLLAAGGLFVVFRTVKISPKNEPIRVVPYASLRGMHHLNDIEVSYRLDQMRAIPPTLPIASGGAATGLGAKGGMGVPGGPYPGGGLGYPAGGMGGTIATPASAVTPKTTAKKPTKQPIEPPKEPAEQAELRAMLTKTFAAGGLTVKGIVGEDGYVEYAAADKSTVLRVSVNGIPNDGFVFYSGSMELTQPVLTDTDTLTPIAATTWQYHFYGMAESADVDKQVRKSVQEGVRDFFQAYDLANPRPAAADEGR